jgi:dephospho-CoA kinase
MPALRSLLARTLVLVFLASGSSAEGAPGAPGGRVLGLTGGIASGKSSVSRMLAGLGARVVDADQIARQIVEPGRPAFRAIVRRFGKSVLTPEGSLDRRALGRIVFSNEGKRRELNQITHGRINRAARAEIRRALAEGARLVIYDAALIVENGWQKKLDGLIVVSVPERVQLERLVRRDGLDRRSALDRVRSQLPLAERLAVADFVIDNSGSLEQTRAQVEKLWPTLLTPARR